MRNPFKALWQAVKTTGEKVQQVVAAIGMTIGVPSTWFTYGYPPNVDWNRIEEIYRTFPMVSYAIEQLAEQAIGPGFYLKPAAQADPNEKANLEFDENASQQAIEICEDFNQRVKAKEKMFRIARELGAYGNCPVERRFDRLEMDDADPYKASKLGDFVTIEILPITTMRIVPSMYGGVSPARGFIQIIMGQYNKFSPEQIAWFRVNMTGGQVGNDFYGMGLIQPVADYVWGIQKMEEYMIRIMSRYAAPKIHWKLGDDKNRPSKKDVDDWTESIKTVLPEDDYVSFYTVNAETLEPDLRARFEEYVSHFRQMIVVGLQNPNLNLVALTERVSDASSNAIQEGWNRKIQTIQEQIKSLWEDMMFKPLIVQAGLDERYTPELIFGEQETEDPIERKKELISLLAGTIQLTARSRLDFENLLRQEYDMESIDVEAELTNQAVQAQQQLEASTKADDGDKQKKLEERHLEALTQLNEYLKNRKVGK